MTNNTDRTRQVSPGNTAYYLDALTGDDRHDGTAPDAAWKTLARASLNPYAPGDQILLQGRQTFSGTLALDGHSHGTPDNPLSISSFGTGRATIDGGTGDGIVLTVCTWVMVSELNVVGCGRKNGSNGAGVLLRQTEHNELSNLDIRGFRVAGVSANGDADLSLTHIFAHDNGFAGICTDGGRDGFPRARNLYIADCRAENNPGDPYNLTNHSGNGILVSGVDGALIEYCAASRNGWDMPRDGNGPVGIWGWDCTHLTIQHCIAYDNQSPGADGGGFDFDGGVTDSIIQDCLSYNNMGCGYLFCQFPGGGRWQNNILRRCVSINDGRKNFHAGIGLWLDMGGISDALIEHNVVINPQHAVSTIGDLPGMIYRNNVFLTGGTLLDGDFTHSRFENNLYWNSGSSPFLQNGEVVYLTLEEWAAVTGQEMQDSRLLGRQSLLPLPLPDLDQLPTDPRQLANHPLSRLASDLLGIES